MPSRRIDFLVWMSLSADRGSAVHDANRRVEDLEVSPIRTDHSGVIPPGGEYDRGVDDVSRSGGPAQHSRCPRTGIGQWLHKDVPSVE